MKKRPSDKEILDQQRIDHHRAEVKGPAGSGLQKTVYEQRGIRSLAIEVFDDPRVTVAVEQVKNGPWDLFEMFREAADVWLREHGERDYLQTIKAADAAKNGGIPEGGQAIDDSTMRLWAAGVGKRHGYLSPPAVAANFLSTSDILHRRLANDPELRQAVYEFADAWHWFHFEAQGEHEVASLGLKTFAGGAAGPKAAKQRAAQKWLVVRSKYLEFAADPANGRKRYSAKAAALRLRESINSILAELKLRPVSERDLSDFLRKLIKPPAAE